MFNSDVDSFLDTAVIDAFNDEDTNSSLSHIINDTGFSMIHFVRHPARELVGPIRRISQYPFCTAPTALMSTMSPTLRKVSFLADMSY